MRQSLARPLDRLTRFFGAQVEPRPYKPTCTEVQVARIVELSTYTVPSGAFCVRPCDVLNPHGPRAIVFRLDGEGK